ncbi:MAG TPA: SDR family oxidoreductase [Alphaproteobacteria bacterium]|nr:SDR family oxidoreductase [Alphaproteobacteria bacterium]
MDLGINGKRALVLASSRGLGLGIAEALAGEDANVLLCGRSADRLEAAATAISARGAGTASHVAIDLADAGSTAALHAAAQDMLGGIDILINNTGGPPPGSITGPDLALWREQFETMVVRVIDMTNRCLPGMQKAGWGRIVTVASSGVIQPIANLGLSNALRSALVGWSKTLAGEVAGDGVTVNIVVPGRIHTERVDELDAAAARRQDKAVAEVAAASRATIPAGRYGRIEEFAAVAAFLASAPASYVTGSIVRCDGGAIRSV